MSAESSEQINETKVDSASWQPKSKKVHIIISIAIGIGIIGIIVFVIMGLLYPVCDETQQHTFFGCKCKSDGIYDSTLKKCVCALNGTQPALDCARESLNSRVVFSVENDFLDPKNDVTQQDGLWVFTNNAS